MDRIYCGPPPLPQDLWASWNFDPLLVLSLLVLTFWVRRSPAGLGAVAILFVAFVSPLCALSSALFSARVVHHVLLIAAAAPLLALAMPRRDKGAIAGPFLVSTVILWGWHLPVAYDLALSNVAVYWLMQISLLASAVWFWRAVLSGKAAVVDRIAFIVAGFAQMGMLGAILTFAPSALYAAHALAPVDWGMTPLWDQQLGGLIMWVPAGLPYAVAAALLARHHWGQMTRGVAW
ncbi:cytochrome c oxidase assembly protein [Neptunicoccus sediminis]|uniref:cytochrome c oxidase assembly protein n=1 Tax=Neptunicoccus sediminis TaxID=1892596 RepID=UPI000845EDB3|nr:cytochrome c oxidase assembly protein [Neptunicoccus sediminis]